MTDFANPLWPRFPYQLILGSASPRRGELLANFGLEFSVRLPAIEESRRPGESPRDYVRRNAEEKAAAVLAEAHVGEQKALVLSADTIVVLGSDVLEKPASADEARTMLERLSGREHEVITAFCLASSKEGQNLIVKDVSTKVEFVSLTSREIDFYIASGEPFDKAGGYGIQGIGGLWVRRIEGSYSNVVGLPLAEVGEAITQLVNSERS